MISILPCCFFRNIQQLIERNIYIVWRRFIPDGTAYLLSFTYFAIGEAAPGRWVTCV
jgi:hypothetical protein